MADHKPGSCPKDCPRRKVGCRTDCPDWAEHERLKAERYAAAHRAAEVAQSTEAWRRHYTAKLRRKARGQKG